ncbi:MAG: helix-turn-helix transcriptional regulator [Vallitaleaceae bacterium]|nr:helix-turn-helix transcriptional regulator [Vallitaleaceae bacterium]
MDLRIFASNVSKLRIDKMWSQEDLASFLNVSRQAVSKWETAQSLPDIEGLLIISKLFAITINDLVEKPRGKGISDIEEIIQIDKEISKRVLNSFELMDVYKAAKGVSPEVLSYMSEIYEIGSFLDEVKNHGPVKIQEIELLHKQIVQKINIEVINN